MNKPHPTPLRGNERAKTFFTANEVTSALGISRATLYAYVSRGLIRSEEADNSKRTRRYHGEDVDRLRRRQEQRRDPATSAAETLNWGVPIVDSAITRIADGHCYYRGHDIVELAASRTVEEVASLIWTGSFDRWESLGGRVALSDKFWTVRAQLAHVAPYELMQVMLPLAAVRDRAAVDLRPEAVASTGRRILATLVMAVTGRPPDVHIASTLASHFAPMSANAPELIGMALILCADHELNTSSFSARCVASTMASPYAVVQAGLAALSGYKHGGMSELVEKMFAECEGLAPGEVKARMHDRLRLGERLPGFGHALYSDGDPRGRCLVDALRGYGLVDATAQAVIDGAFELIGEHPNVDCGLVLLRRALGMPAGSALTLFAMGRTIGWIGHAIEEYQKGRIIRPRARYVGVLSEGIEPGDA